MECRCAIRFLQDSSHSLHGLTPGVQFFLVLPLLWRETYECPLRIVLPTALTQTQLIKVATTYKKIMSSVFKAHLLSSQTNDPIFLPSIHLPIFQFIHPPIHLLIHSFIYPVIHLFNHFFQPARSLFAYYTTRCTLLYNVLLGGGGEAPESRSVPRRKPWSVERALA